MLERPSRWEATPTGPRLKPQHQLMSEAAEWLRDVADHVLKEWAELKKDLK